MIGWQEGHPAHKKPHLLISRGSLPEKVDEEEPRGNRLTQVDVEKQPFNRSSGIMMIVVCDCVGV